MATFPNLKSLEYYSKVIAPLLLIVGAAVAGTLSIDSDSTTRIFVVLASVVLIITAILLEISLTNKTNERIDQLEIQKLKSRICDLENQIHIKELEIRVKELEKK